MRNHVKEYGEAVACYRKTTNMSVEDLAKKASLTPTTIRAIENGTRTDINSSELLAIAWSLGVSVDALLNSKIDPDNMRIRVCRSANMLDAANQYFADLNRVTQ